MIAPPTLALRVVAGLKEKMLSGTLSPGSKLPSESELISEYAVSRTVVREAVTRLRAEGLVETFRGRGSFVLAVPEPSPFRLESSAIRSRRDVLDMVDLRLGFESEAAALAAARVTPSGAEELRTTLSVLLSPGTESLIEADFAFHRAIAVATGNRFYVDLIESLGPMMIMLPRTRLGAAFSMTNASHLRRVQREHENVADAVLAGDGETARAAMRVHLGNTRRRLERQ